MRKMSGLVAGIVGCVAVNQAAGAMPVDNTLAVRIPGGNDAFYRVHCRHRRHGSSDHYRYQSGRYLYRPQPYYYSYPDYTQLPGTIPAILLGTATRRRSIYPLTMVYGGHHFGGHLFEGHHLYGHHGHH